MKNHPIADIWPMMSEAEISHLSADIAAQGLLNPIWVYEGMILDGRNRFKACQLAGIAPRFQDYEGTNPVQFAFSQNEERRHLNSGQRAALAVEIKPQLEVEARKRYDATVGRPKKESEESVQIFAPITPPTQPERSRTEAAKITGTNHAYVNAAEKIKETAPDIFDKLKSGNITMQDARREASRRPATDEWLPDERERQEAVLRGETVVANFERDKNLIQWASQNGKLAPVNRGTKWGNPFILGIDGSRDDVCDNYGAHYLTHKPSLLKAAHELKGKVLACHCYPERCHGDELKELI